MSKLVYYGLFKDDDQVMAACKSIRAKGITINDVISPFPLHGIDPILGIKESRLHIAGFTYGLTGGLFAFLTMTWISVRDWPNVFGGKPFFSLPAWIPIIFESTVLSAAVGMVVSFCIVNMFAPGVVPEILDDRLTDDTFAVVFDKQSLNESQLSEITQIMQANGAVEFHTKEVSSKFKYSR
jgi:hypothetical protein